MKSRIYLPRTTFCRNDVVQCHTHWQGKAVAKIFRVSGDPIDPSSTILAKLIFGGVVSLTLIKRILTVALA